MIDPKELRFGNYIHGTCNVRGLRIPQDPALKIVTLKFNGTECVVHNQIPACVEEWLWFQYNEIEPIPLTEEWLNRFGFKVFTNDSPSPGDWHWSHPKFPGALQNGNWNYHLHAHAPMKYV